MWFNKNGGKIIGPSSIFGHIGHLWANLIHQPTFVFYRDLANTNSSFTEIEAFQE